MTRPGIRATAGLGSRCRWRCDLLSATLGRGGRSGSSFQNDGAIAECHAILLEAWGHVHESTALDADIAALASDPAPVSMLHDLMAAGRSP